MVVVVASVGVCPGFGVLLSVSVCGVVAFVLFDGVVVIVVVIDAVVVGIEGGVAVVGVADSVVGGVGGVGFVFGRCWCCW